MIDFPNSPTVGQQFISGGSSWTWDGVHWKGGAPAPLQTPLVFTVSGKPMAGALITMPIAMGLTIAASLANSYGYATTASAASAVFTLNKISGGSTTALGTITFATGVKTPTFAGAGGSLVAGDTVQLVAPASQDGSLADCGVTILALRT